MTCEPKQYVIVHSVEGVQDNVDRHGIRLGLQNLTHHITRVITDILNPVVEVLQVILLHTLLHDHQGTLL